VDFVIILLTFHWKRLSKSNSPKQSWNSSFCKSLPIEKYSRSYLY